MHLMLQKDIKQLMLDTEKIKRGLARLDQDYSLWDRNHENEDLAEISEEVKRLETDVIWMLSDCTALSQRFQGDILQPVLDSLHRALEALNSLFNDLKKARIALNDAYIHPANLQQLAIDWGRLRKWINQIQEHLQEGDSILNLMKLGKVIPYHHPQARS